MVKKITINEAINYCNQNDYVQVSIRDLADDDCNATFSRTERSEYQGLFKDVQTVMLSCDDFMKQMLLYTSTQDMQFINPVGLQKIVLFKKM